MWELTVEQKRKSEYSGNIITESVKFRGYDIHELGALAERMMDCDNALETSYRIESVKEGEN